MRNATRLTYRRKSKRTANHKSKRTSRRKIKKTKITNKQKQFGGKQYTTSTSDLFVTSIKNGFKIMAEDQGWTDYDKASDAFLTFLRNMPENGTELETYLNKMIPSETTSPTVGGMFDPDELEEGVHENAKSFLNYFVRFFVGPIDTSCDKLLASIMTATYCIGIAVIAKRFMFPANNDGNQPETVEDFLKGNMGAPEQYALFANFKFLYKVQNDFFSILERMFAHIISKMDVQVAGINYAPMAIVSMIRSYFYTPHIHKTFFIKPISCMCAPFIKSCEEKCAN